MYQNPKYTTTSMPLIKRITQHFEESGQLKADLAELLATPIAQAAELIVEALLKEKKVLACGNGGSAAIAQYFSAMMLNRYQLERPGLAAIALCADNTTLTAIATDHHFETIYAQQILALGMPDDILLAISVNGNCRNMLRAVQAAKERSMKVIALSGSDGGSLVELLDDHDIHLGVPHDNSARVQEVYVLIVHCLCDAIDCILLGVH